MSWESSYRSGFAPWQRSGLNPAFAHWFDQPNNFAFKGTRILVPGCGTSLEPVEFARRGAVVTSIDVAPSAIAFQNEQFRKAGVVGQNICDDVLTWRSKQPFDLVYEQTCLCAILPSERVAYATMAKCNLRRGGRLYALFMQTGGRGGPPFHCDLSEMASLFSDTVWRWSGEKPFRSNHPLGVYELGIILETAVDLG